MSEEIHADHCGCKPFDPSAKSPMHMLAFTDNRCIALRKKAEEKP